MRNIRGSANYKWNGSAMKVGRMEQDMTLQELAEAIGTSKSYVWEMERSSQPTVGYAYNIAKILKKPLSFFMIEC